MQSQQSPALISLSYNLEKLTIKTKDRGAYINEENKEILVPDSSAKVALDKKNSSAMEKSSHVVISTAMSAQQEAPAKDSKIDLKQEFPSKYIETQWELVNEFKYTAHAKSESLRVVLKEFKLKNLNKKPKISEIGFSDKLYFTNEKGDGFRNFIMHNSVETRMSIKFSSKNYLNKFLEIFKNKDNEKLFFASSCNLYFDPNSQEHIDHLIFSLNNFEAIDKSSLEKFLTHAQYERDLLAITDAINQIEPTLFFQFDFNLELDQSKLARPLTIDVLINRNEVEVAFCGSDNWYCKGTVVENYLFDYLRKFLPEKEKKGEHWHHFDHIMIQRHMGTIALTVNTSPFLCKEVGALNLSQNRNFLLMSILSFYQSNHLLCKVVDINTPENKSASFIKRIGLDEFSSMLSTCNSDNTPLMIIEKFNSSLATIHSIMPKNNKVVMNDKELRRLQNPRSITKKLSADFNLFSAEALMIQQKAGNSAVTGTPMSTVPTVVGAAATLAAATRIL